MHVASDVVSIAAGDRFSAFVKSDGALWTVGSGSYGQLGIGTVTAQFTPMAVAGDVSEVFAGFAHLLFVKSDRSLWAMGYNSNGQLGDGTDVSRSTPVLIASDVASVSAGSNHTFFVKTNGTLWGTGKQRNWSDRGPDSSRCLLGPRHESRGFHGQRDRISTRAMWLANDDVLITGFVIAGTGSKKLLIHPSAILPF